MHSIGWYLDIGCSKRMSGDESKLTHKTDFLGGNVIFSDGVSSQIISKGALFEQGLHVLNDVLLVKGLKAILLIIP